MGSKRRLQHLTSWERWKQQSALFYFYWLPGDPNEPDCRLLHHHEPRLCWQSRTARKSEGELNFSSNPRCRCFSDPVQCVFLTFDLSARSCWLQKDSLKLGDLPIHVHHIPFQTSVFLPIKKKLNKCPLSSMQYYPMLFLGKQVLQIHHEFIIWWSYSNISQLTIW